MPVSSPRPSLLLLPGDLSEGCTKQEGGRPRLWPLRARACTPQWWCDTQTGGHALTNGGVILRQAGIHSPMVV
eukprot:3988987-Pyramimonas_sp.AAC.2